MPRFLRRLSLILVLCLGVFVSASAADEDDGARSLNLYTRFLIRTPDKAAIQQIEQLLIHHQFASAELLARLVTTPQGVWLTGGSPEDVAKLVRKTLRDAQFQHRLAVFVPYNIPGRDCGGY